MKKIDLLLKIWTLLSKPTDVDIFESFFYLFTDLKFFQKRNCIVLKAYVDHFLFYEKNRFVTENMDFIK